MDGTAHGSTAFWFYFLLHYLIWGTYPPPLYSVLAILFGNLPDFDSLYYMLKGKDPNANNFQHHLYFWSHWPIAYMPILALSIIALMLDWNAAALLVPTIGIYTHLICDSACCGDGMMWGKIPWKQDQFAPFFNFFSSQTDGYHGSFWRVRWRRTGMFKIAQLEASAILIFCIWYWIRIGFSLANLIIIIYFMQSMLMSYLKIDPKYYQEPPNGRYNDYRKLPAYLKWMEQAGYKFNSRMHAIKIKPFVTVS